MVACSSKAGKGLVIRSEGAVSECDSMTGAGWSQRETDEGEGKDLLA